MKLAKLFAVGRPQADPRVTGVGAVSESHCAWPGLKFEWSLRALDAQAIEVHGQLDCFAVVRDLTGTVQ